MDLIFAYLAGLLTLINPCVLPVLPIVLASSLQTDRRAPLALAAGMSVSFVTLGLGVAALGPALGLNPETVSQVAAVMMIAFGLVMLVPALGGGFAIATAGLSARADAGITAASDNGLPGQFVGGALLGAVWSPCIGPTLGAAIALASQGQDLGRAFAIMVFFALGVSTLILAIAYGARRLLQRNQAGFRHFATRAKPIMGSIFILIGLALLARLNHRIDGWLLQVLPPWLVDFSVSI
jgi:cytochrome c-type biogenesis protein